jgi:hypothetical protein
VENSEMLDIMRKTQLPNPRSRVEFAIEFLDDSSPPSGQPTKITSFAAGMLKNLKEL